MTRRTVKVTKVTTVEIELNAKTLAEAFCELDDEEMAQFFIECAALASGWRATGGLGADWQWFTVGRHLRDCSCSTEDAREMVRSIASATEAA